jgi:glycosyltransferase involved in cell wall biosynthesis
VEELISVIVPIYKVEKYLKKCIDSIINQTYRNLEIILVDDGSPDYCGEICDDFKLKDERVVVIHKENGGLSDARNVGLDIAKGKYIMFVDSDDYIAENMVYKLYSTLRENNADMSLCGHIYVDENGNLVNSHGEIKDEVISGTDALKKNIDGEICTALWSKLYRTNLFQTIRFPFGKLYEDKFTTHLIFGKCKRVSCVSDRLYFYLQRNGSIMWNTRNKVSIKRLDEVDAYLEYSLYLKTASIENVYIRKAYFKSIFIFAYVFFNILNPSKSEVIKLEETRKLLKKNRKLGKGSSIIKKTYTIIVLYFPNISRLMLRIIYKIKNKS